MYVWQLKLSWNCVKKIDDESKHNQQIYIKCAEKENNQGVAMAQSKSRHQHDSNDFARPYESDDHNEVK